ncbi:uncharacterized protein LOC130889493 isoform X2 [Chionomys nivalis]|uniref:uncharacterized protein LOC130889493 isoform X2 n=1 Tax=Chionomys nivalis TaxID=269649 RepID=UPI002593D538|nr:uncharacterized protein LOC130889493 isoform X2 [Chionomys nivalis]
MDRRCYVSGTQSHPPLHKRRRTGRDPRLLSVVASPPRRGKYPRHGQRLNAAGAAGRRVQRGPGEEGRALNLGSRSVLFPSRLIPLCPGDWVLGKNKPGAAALFTSSAHRCRHRRPASLTLASPLGGWVFHPPALSLPCGQGCEDQWHPAPRTAPSGQRRPDTSPCAPLQCKICSQTSEGLAPASRSEQRQRSLLEALPGAME